MTRKQLVQIGGTVLLAAGLSAFVAYRLGLRRSRTPVKVLSERPGVNCLDFHDAGSHTGETACVSGRVLRVFDSSAGNTFLDFCAEYRECPFTSIIFGSDRNKFGDLNVLGGRQVEVRGFISVYQGRAEIVIRDPDQIRLVEQAPR